MNIALAKPWEDFLAEIVETGRFASPSDALEEGLRLVALREERLDSLRRMIQASLAEGGAIPDEELDAVLAEEAEKLRREGL